MRKTMFYSRAARTSTISRSPAREIKLTFKMRFQKNLLATQLENTVMRTREDKSQSVNTLCIATHYATQELKAQYCLKQTVPYYTKTEM